MDKIKLFNNVSFDIEDGARLDSITIVTKSAAKAREAAEAITAENLAHVEFLHGDEVTGIYENLGLTPVEEGMSNPVVDGKKITVSLYQQ